MIWASLNKAPHFRSHFQISKSLLHAASVSKAQHVATHFTSSKQKLSIQLATLVNELLYTGLGPPKKGSTHSVVSFYGKLFSAFISPSCHM